MSVTKQKTLVCTGFHRVLWLPFRLEKLVSHVCSHPELPTPQSGQTKKSGDTVSILASARTTVFDSRLRICQI